MCVPRDRRVSPASLFSLRRTTLACERKEAGGEGTWNTGERHFFLFFCRVTRVVRNDLPLCDLSWRLLCLHLSLGRWGALCRKYGYGNITLRWLFRPEPHRLRPHHYGTPYMSSTGSMLLMIASLFTPHSCFPPVLLALPSSLHPSPPFPPRPTTGPFLNRNARCLNRGR